MFLDLDEHRQYLSDETRIAAFQRAIKETVRPGHIVLDLGCGTGILGMLACQAGARRVYSVDAGGMIEVARAIGHANGFADRMVFIRGLSTRIDLPEKVDVVLADQIGRFGFEAGVIEYFNDARLRFLKPRGRLLPSRLDLQVAPVENPAAWERAAFWVSTPVPDLDFSAAHALALNTGYPVRHRVEQLLSAPATGASLDLSRPLPQPLAWTVSVTAQRAGTMHGLGGWFLARLSSHVTMSNSPAARDSIERRHMFFPLDAPTPVGKGDQIRISMTVLPSDMVVSWKVEVWPRPRRSGARASRSPRSRSSHCTLRGMLITSDDLRKLRPEFRPSLTPWAKARLAVLELCDGGTALAKIQREIFRQHRGLFPDAAAAATFVAGIVNRHTH